MFLIVNPDERVDRIIKQLENLQDIIEVLVRQDYDNTLSDLMHDLTAELHVKSPEK
jgi:acetolactate synthase small subunit